MMFQGLKKWNSRKLGVLVGSVVAILVNPALAPFLGKAAPVFIAIQGLVDAIKEWRGAGRG